MIDIVYVVQSRSCIVSLNTRTNISSKTLIFLKLSLRIHVEYEMNISLHT